MRRTAASRPRRGLSPVLAATAAVAFVTVLAAGCSDGDSDAGEDVEKDDAPITALSGDQIEEAVLQLDNLGEDWTSAPSTDDDGDAPDCLADVATLIDQLERKAKGGTEFSYGDLELTVESTVSAYENEAAITALFDQVQTVLAACTTISDVDDRGYTTELTLTVDDGVTFDDVDDQYHLVATGTISTPEGQSADLYIEQTSVRVGPNVGTINTFDVQSRTTEHAAWAEIAVERLVDVAEGEEPEETTAPAPA